MASPGAVVMASDADIFVAIASYCDPVLPWTLDDCLAKARHPERLRFGICWQFDTEQEIDLERFRRDGRFRFEDRSVQESRGGCWARSIAQTLWDGEPYTLQIDSHMAFAPGWDANLVRMMRSFPADKPLITMNAPLFRLDESLQVSRDTKFGIRGTCIREWDEGSLSAPWFDWGTRVTAFPARSRFLSGMFSFTLGAWTDEVRQDPDHYYWGEEFALTLRSFTHGYDLFVPDEMVVWHLLHRKAPPRRHWEHGRAVVSELDRVAQERLRRLAYSDDPGDQASLGRYGLGRLRSRSDYERFAGMDLKARRAHPDVFAGRPPDPVTIRCDADWDDCVSCEEYKKQDLRQGRDVA